MVTRTNLKPVRSLAQYACDPATSRGRLLDQPASPTRTEFQRDRDRIVHSTAFRRLKYKTQVFVYHEGDHYRTRLTHSLEVSQVARSLARSLMLDEDLAEAIALAHDLGHPPFGHAGERALDACMAPYGGFDHNAQSLAVVTRLEKRYAAFDGLNLAWETLEGIVKHNGPLLDASGQGSGHNGGCAVPAAILDYVAGHDLQLATQAGGEAQCAAIADDIAYSSHDFDDGLRAGLFTFEEIAAAVPMISRMFEEVRTLYPAIDPSRLVHETVRRIITELVEDVLVETERRIRTLRPISADDIRAAPRPTVAFSQPVARHVAELKAFLFARMYRHERVMRVMGEAEAVVRALFAAWLAEPERLAPEWREEAAAQEEPARARIIADYIAGMTDRYALAEHRRMFDAAPELR